MRAERLVCIGAFVLASSASAQADGAVLGRRAVQPTVNVKVWNAAGRIRFVGWDKDSIVLRGRGAQVRQVRLVGNDTAAKISRDGWPAGDEANDLTVYLPRRATVSVKTVSADISASDVGGWFYTVSGTIRLAGSASSVQAESMSGNLDLNVATPWIRAQTGSGHLLLRGAAQDADLSTVGGTLSVATSTVLRGRFASVSGEIQYAALPVPGAIFDFSTHSGAVDLLLPAAASAALTLSSIGGTIENGFTTVRPVSTAPHAMRLVLGRGDAQIVVRTFKGVIHLRPQS